MPRKCLTGPCENNAVRNSLHCTRCKRQMQYWDNRPLAHIVDRQEKYKLWGATLTVITRTSTVNRKRINARK